MLASLALSNIVSSYLVIVVILDLSLLRFMYILPYTRSAVPYYGTILYSLVFSYYAPRAPL